MISEYINSSHKGTEIAGCGTKITLTTRSLPMSVYCTIEGYSAKSLMTGSSRSYKYEVIYRSTWIRIVYSHFFCKKFISELFFRNQLAVPLMLYI